MHDEACESIEVDIGVGNLNSPCSCEVRGLLAQIAALQRDRQRLDWLVRMLEEQYSFLFIGGHRITTYVRRDIDAAAKQMGWDK